MKYQDFIAAKSFAHIDAGFDAIEIPWPLKDFQIDAVNKACVDTKQWEGGKLCLS